MSNIRLFSKVLGNSASLSKYILDNFIKIINKTFFTQSNAMQQDIASIVIQSIKNQPEYSSLKGGELRHQFGIANTAVVDQILSQLNDIEIKINKPKAISKGIEANLVINMIKENYADIVSSGSGVYASEKGSQINWLRWLLLEGNNSVVIGYRYLPKTDANSRTGKGIMISGQSSIYRVPPQFAGTASDNWITRGIDQALPQIESYINRMVQKSL